MKKISIGILIGLIIGITTTIIAATYKFKADEVEYIPNDTNWSVGNAQEAMNELYTLYKIRKAGSSGIFSVSDNMLATGYMKSTANDNNVIFGGYCWKVIRVTDDNEVRMIYNGLPQDGECNRTGTDTQIGTSKYSTTYNVTAYASSTVKGVVDNWYNTNLASNFGDKISGIDLITREEASTVGGGYLVSGQKYWTQSATGQSTSQTSSCTYSICSGTSTCTSSSNTIYVVNTSGGLEQNNNGTYSTCSAAASKTCSTCDYWYTNVSGGTSCELCQNNTVRCCYYAAKCNGVNKNTYYINNPSGQCCQSSNKTDTTCKSTPNGDTLAVRPVLTLNSTASLYSGEGTTSNPYYMK